MEKIIKEFKRIYYNNKIQNLRHKIKSFWKNKMKTKDIDNYELHLL